MRYLLAIDDRRMQFSGYPVQIRKLERSGRPRHRALSEQGFLIVHLLAGRVSTVIDGKEQSWKTGPICR
jgi:hypothetical protein